MQWKQQFSLTYYSHVIAVDRYVLPTFTATMKTTKLSIRPESMTKLLRHQFNNTHKIMFWQWREYTRLLVCLSVFLHCSIHLFNTPTLGPFAVVLVSSIVIHVQRMMSNKFSFIYSISTRKLWKQCLKAQTETKRSRQRRYLRWRRLSIVPSNA